MQIKRFTEVSVFAVPATLHGSWIAQILLSDLIANHQQEAFPISLGIHWPISSLSDVTKPRNDCYTLPLKAPEEED